MGWEKRGNHLYYYRGERVDGRVVKTYFGRGELAELVAARETMRRDIKEHLRRRECIAAGEAVAAGLLAEVDGLAAAAAAAALLAAGYRQHDRGAWRKRRGATEG